MEATHQSVWNRPTPRTQFAADLSTPQGSESSPGIASRVGNVVVAVRPMVDDVGAATRAPLKPGQLGDQPLIVEQHCRCSPAARSRHKSGFSSAATARSRPRA